MPFHLPSFTSSPSPSFKPVQIMTTPISFPILPPSTHFSFCCLQALSQSPFFNLFPIVLLSIPFPFRHLKPIYHSVLFNNSSFISTSFRSFPILPLQPHSHSASFNHFTMLPPSTHLPVPYPNPLIPILTTFSPCCCQ